MPNQWTAICERNDQGWTAYFGELPQAMVRGLTEGDALRNLELAVSMIVSAGMGGCDVGAEDFV